MKDDFEILQYREPTLHSIRQSICDLVGVTKNDDNDEYTFDV